MAKRLRSKHLIDLAFVSDPQVGAQGSCAAAVVTRIERTADAPPRYRSAIRLYDLEGAASRDFTRGTYSDTAPRFSPTGGHLAYLSVVDEAAKPQLQLIALDGGEGRTQTGHRAGVSAFCWHPGGERIAYLTRGDRHDEAGAGRTITGRRYKLDGVGFLPAGPTELRLIELASGVTSVLDRFDVAPTELCYAASGRLFVVAADEDDDRDAIDRGCTQVWRYSAKGKRGKGLLKRSELVAAIAPTPDGDSFAMIAPASPGDFVGPKGVWTVAARGGRAKLLSGAFDAGPTISGDARYGSYGNTPVWNEAGTALLVNLNIEGRSGLARLRLDGGCTQLQGDARAVTAFAASRGRAVFVAERPDAPGELFVRFKNGRERQLSHENDAFGERHALRRLDGPFEGAGAGPQPLAYWALTPKKARKDGARVVQVHGGPHTNYGYGFSFEFQLLAAAGYSVVFGNPRGSSSYGGSFARATLGAYGGVDAEDVLAICDAAERRFGAAPVHLTGGSYGGFMTNWLLGHSDRFTSAVTQRSISNWLSFYGSSDIGFSFTEREVGGVPWEAVERLWAQSPLKYVAEIDTPLLLIHSEQDLRCPIEQAEQLFVALVTLGRVPVEMIRFPDEGHELSRSGRPDRRIERLDAIIGWFERHPKRRPRPQRDLPEPQVRVARS